MIMNERTMNSYPTKFESFHSTKVAKLHTNPYNVVTCLPNPYKLSILDDIWRAAILSFSSSKYFYSWLRLSNLVDLLFEYLSFFKQTENKRTREETGIQCNHIVGIGIRQGLRPTPEKGRRGRYGGAT